VDGLPEGHVAHLPMRVQPRQRLGRAGSGRLRSRPPGGHRRRLVGLAVPQGGVHQEDHAQPGGRDLPGWPGSSVFGVTPYLACVDRLSPIAREPGLADVRSGSLVWSSHQAAGD
jgi:hypothetical protein